MSLVAASDFEDLPDEPIARWLQLRDLLEKRLDSLVDFNNDTRATYDFLEYMKILSAAADELEIGALEEISPGNIHDEFDLFRASVSALATRLSLRSGRDNPAQSVALARPTRKKILVEIENLRSKIHLSELSEVQKVKAEKKIDQLQILVVAPRTDISRVGFLLAGIGAFAVGTTSVLADFPQAIGTISVLIGADKLEEENDQILIENAGKKLQIQDLREEPNEEIPF
ncbi:hypothetical protein SAMN05444414_1453 [Roseovarius marisflavi]|uniref:Uncharacterized protein n=1 Tax=Roseovarius marisflavi TaxID=1054996 RepID=A0A1M7DNN9_9RHOB|nr:hypothetical protein [Roseovarius marisflavi]SHL80993.1 hypothetical protein SAMN05444414_1453 [Roseovarius marisflavi]